MTIDKSVNDKEMRIALTGRLDTMSSPELDELVANGLEGVADLTLDFKGVDYISSAGLRVLLRAKKKMDACGKMKLVGVSPMITEIFEITGFDKILTVE